MSAEFRKVLGHCLSKKLNLFYSQYPALRPVRALYTLRSGRVVQLNTSRLLFPSFGITEQSSRFVIWDHKMNLNVNHWAP